VSAAVEIVAYGPERRATVQRFAEQTWRRPRSEAFYRWRYDEAPAFQAFLALRGGECLAMQTAFRRPYRVGEREVHILEPFDPESAGPPGGG
jgi:hypothetical protein